MSKTKSKATPGPWRVQYTPPKVPNPASYRIMGDDKDGVPHTIAHIFSKTNEANAALIAAAPTMLEALKLLVKEVHVLPGTGKNDGNVGHRHINAALAAIAKAEGRDHE